MHTPEEYAKNIRHLPLKDVEEIELELTGTCNLNCPLCTRNNPSAKGLLRRNVRTPDEIRHQIEAFPNLKRVCLAGVISEPTLHPNFMEIWDFLNNSGFEIELYTNGNTHKENAWWARLGELTNDKSKVYFTVCGSTQEIHEKYRVGSDLNEILRHARAYRLKRKEDDLCPTDVIQHITFRYNEEDSKSERMQEIIQEFNHTFLIESLPYNERFNLTKSKDFNMLEPLSSYYTTLKKTTERKFWSNTKNSPEVKCKSIDTKFLSIDQFGRISPCFLYRMNVGAFKDVNQYEYSQDYMYQEEIEQGEYSFCFECDKQCTRLLDQYGLERMA